jgi:myo-inositol-1-phosphate synthase
MKEDENGRVRVGIIGVGNCASSLVQGGNFTVTPARTISSRG